MDARWAVLAMPYWPYHTVLPQLVVALQSGVSKSSQALAELKAVDGAYPLYGAFTAEPARPIQQLLADVSAGIPHRNRARLGWMWLTVE